MGTRTSEREPPRSILRERDIVASLRWYYPGQVHAVGGYRPPSQPGSPELPRWLTTDRLRRAAGRVKGAVRDEECRPRPRSHLLCSEQLFRTRVDGRSSDSKEASMRALVCVTAGATLAMFTAF